MLNDNQDNENMSDLDALLEANGEDEKEARRLEKIALKEAKKAEKEAAKLAKKQAKLDKKAAKKKGEESEEDSSSTENDSVESITSKASTDNSDKKVSDDTSSDEPLTEEEARKKAYDSFFDTSLELEQMKAKKEKPVKEKKQKKSKNDDEDSASSENSNNDAASGVDSEKNTEAKEDNDIKLVSGASSDQTIDKSEDNDSENTGSENTDSEITDADEEEQETKKKKKKSASSDRRKPEEVNIVKDLLNLIIYIGIVIVLCYVIITYVGQRTTVHGTSMVPTLADEDNLWIDKFVYIVKDPERFDIIVFPYQDSDVYYIKRIIGLPGETVQIGINGVIYINGQPLEENYGYETIDPSLIGVASEPILLGEDEYFVLGDNRNNSRDSRWSDVGNISRDEIVGKAVLRLTPFESFGTLE